MRVFLLDPLISGLRPVLDHQPGLTLSLSAAAWESDLENLEDEPCFHCY